MLKQKINMIGLLLLAVVVAFNNWLRWKSMVKTSNSCQDSFLSTSASIDFTTTSTTGHNKINNNKRSSSSDVDDNNNNINFMEESGLRVIVTGIEHSGTTALSSVLFNAPCVLGAFETGLLLADKTPSDFKNVHPFYEWMQKPAEKTGRFYGINSSEDIDAILSAPSFATMYSTLRRLSPLMTNSDHAGEDCPRGQPLGLIDKTPRYIYNLTKIMGKAPGVPVVVIMKEFDSIRESHASRGHVYPKEKYYSVWDQITKSQTKFPGRVLIVKQEVFNNDANSVMEGVFDFLGLPWNFTYLSMEPLYAKVKKFGAKKLPPIQKGAHSPDRTRQQQTNNRETEKKR